METGECGSLIPLSSFPCNCCSPIVVTTVALSRSKSPFHPVEGLPTTRCQTISGRNLKLARLLVFQDSSQRAPNPGRRPRVHIFQLTIHGAAKAKTVPAHFPTFGPQSHPPEAQPKLALLPFRRRITARITKSVSVTTTTAMAAHDCHS